MFGLSRRETPLDPEQQKRQRIAELEALLDKGPAKVSAVEWGRIVDEYLDITPIGRSRQFLPDDETLHRIAQECNCGHPIKATFEVGGSRDGGGNVYDDETAHRNRLRWHQRYPLLRLVNDAAPPWMPPEPAPLTPVFFDPQEEQKARRRLASHNARILDAQHHVARLQVIVDAADAAGERVQMCRETLDQLDRLGRQDWDRWLSSGVKSDPPPPRTAEITAARVELDAAEQRLRHAVAAARAIEAELIEAKNTLTHLLAEQKPLLVDVLLHQLVRDPETFGIRQAVHALGGIMKYHEVSARIALRPRPPTPVSDPRQAALQQRRVDDFATALAGDATAVLVQEE